MEQMKAMRQAKVSRRTRAAGQIPVEVVIEC